MERLFPIMVAGAALWYVADRVSAGASLLPVWMESAPPSASASAYNNGVDYVSPLENAFPLYLTDDPKMMHLYDGYIQGMRTYWGPVKIQSTDGTMWD